MFTWSTRPSRNRVCSRFALPQVWVCSCRSRRSRTSAPTSIIWVLASQDSSGVPREATYLGTRLKARPTSLDWPGQYGRKMSYVVRPSSSASDACTSASTCALDSESKNGHCQPAYLKPASCSVGPPLAWITPSSVVCMLVQLTHRAISSSFSLCPIGSPPRSASVDGNGSVFVAHGDDLEGSGPSHGSCRQRLLSTARRRRRLAAVPVPWDPAHVTARAVS